MPFDFDSDANVNIDGVHKKIHSGWSFEYPYDVAIAADGSIALLIIPAEGEELHYQAAASVADGAARARLYRNPTVANNGSEVIWVNRKDDSDNTLNSEVYVHPSYSVANATKCEVAYLGSGAGPFASGGGANTRDEWIMTYPNKYIAEIVDLSGSTNNCAMISNVYRAGII